MDEGEKTLIQQYFKENSLVKASIDSYNHFIEVELPRIIEENKEIEPAIIPPNIDDFKIRFEKIWMSKPEIIEADGSTRAVYPIEARLRKLSYSAPVYLEVSSYVNGVQRESFKTQIGSVPVMLKSNYCHLHNMTKEELIKVGEDPEDPGGYFIINGTERIVVNIEDLAPNKFLVEKPTTGISKYVGKIFSESGSYRIPHQIEKLRDGIFYISFTRVKRIPVIVVLKALGMTKDEDIMRSIGLENNSEVLINLYDYADIREQEEAIDFIAKKVGITQAKEIRIERMREIMDKYLLPHVGMTKEARMLKAHNLTRMIRKFILVSNEELPVDDKDHYMNKRLKLPGDLLADLFRVNIKILIGDLLYNFQRVVKRGKFPSIRVLIREKLLTQKIYTSMATGNWVGGRKGVSQRIERLNYLQTLSHLQRVVSPLSSSQENFEARSLHSTHLGRLCPSETPEGTNIGLRKNLALLAQGTHEVSNEETLEHLKKLGLKTIEGE